MIRDLDETPLTRTASLPERVRALGKDNRIVMGMVIAAVLVVVPSVVLVVLVATGNATDVGGIVFLLMLLGAGAWLVGAALWQAGGTSALVSFARANDLESLGTAPARHYAARPFADGTHVVHQGVRTREATFVEVGDRITVAARSVSHAQANPELYLRVRLPGPAAPARGPLPAGLDESLRRFAGSYLVEVTGDELTLLGSRPLMPREPGRVVEAFELAEALARTVAPVGGRRPWPRRPARRAPRGPAARSRWCSGRWRSSSSVRS